jgi:hypothetical protein
MPTTRGVSPARLDVLTGTFTPAVETSSRASSDWLPSTYPELSLSTSRSIPGKCTSAVLPSVAFTSDPNQRRWSNCPGSVTKKSWLDGVGEPEVQVGLAERSIQAR